MPTLTCGGFQFADSYLCDRRCGSKAAFRLLAPTTLENTRAVASPVPG